MVARIRTAGPHGSLAQRESAIYQRITNALSNELHNIFVQELGGPRLTVHQRDGIWTLSIGNQMLIQAFPEDAAGAGTTPAQLVRQWKANYRQQLPRAVPPIRVPDWWKEANPEAVAEPERRSHGRPAEDAPLVREVVEFLEAAREMPAECFDEFLPAMEQSLVQFIWTYRHPDCGDPPIEAHIRVRSVLRRARGLSDEQYSNERWWLAGSTIEHLREAMDMPECAGPVPEQRELPDFEAPPEPIAAPAAPVSPATEVAVEAEPATEVEPATDTEPVPQAEADAEPTPRSAPEPDIDPVTITPGMPIQIAALGTGLGESANLLNMGQAFTAPVDQLLVYVQVAGAAPNTVLGVVMQGADGILARRRIRVSGDRKLAVTFAGSAAAAFVPGEYQCILTVNGADAASLPFVIED